MRAVGSRCCRGWDTSQAGGHRPREAGRRKERQCLAARPDRPLGASPGLQRCVGAGKMRSFRGPPKKRMALVGLFSCLQRCDPVFGKIQGQILCSEPGPMQESDTPACSGSPCVPVLRDEDVVAHGCQEGPGEPPGGTGAPAGSSAARLQLLPTPGPAPGSAPLPGAAVHAPRLRDPLVRPPQALEQPARPRDELKGQDVLPPLLHELGTEKMPGVGCFRFVLQPEKEKEKKRKSCTQMARVEATRFYFFNQFLE